MMALARRCVAVVLSLLLAGCLGVPVSTIWKLRKIDVLGVDTAQSRIALHAPEWMHPLFGDIQLHIRSEASGGETRTVVLRLRKVDRPNEITAIQHAGLAVDNLTIFEIEPGDLHRARAHQNQMIALRGDGHDISSTALLQRKGRALCLSFPPPGASTQVDIYVHITNDIGWLLFNEALEVGEIELADGVVAPDAAACATLSTNNADAPSGALSPQSAGAHPKKMRGGVSFQFGK